MRDLITKLTIFSLVFLVIPANHIRALSPQDELEELKTAVSSALPSEWKVAGAEKEVLLFPGVDSLKDRYRGSVIKLVGPTFSKDVTPKGSREKKSITVSESAELFLIPVFQGISRTQLKTDWSTAQREIQAKMSMSAQMPPPGAEESVPFGWNKKFLLVCRKDCGIVKEVAKKLKIPKR